jgi:DNA polymerase
MDPTELDALETQLNSCHDCPLRDGCQSPVGWFGNPRSPIMFVGEGPGGVEDDYGCPLIGPSGQLLDKALWSTNMTRDLVLTTNVVKCRPKGNRTPTIEEGRFCAERWLDKEIEIIKPKVIVALGSVALHYLGKPDDKITKTRGTWFKTKQGIDCIATFHPSYLLRLAGHDQVTAKWHVFYDLEKARAKVLETVPDYKFCSDKPVNLFELFKKRS